MSTLIFGSKLLSFEARKHSKVINTDLDKVGFIKLLGPHLELFKVHLEVKQKG